MAYSRLNLSIFPDGLKKISENLSQDIRLRDEIGPQDNKAGGPYTQTAHLYRLWSINN
jgi:hypothetical protein